MYAYPTFLNCLRRFFENYNGKVAQSFKLTPIVTKKLEILKTKFDCRQTFPAEMLITIFRENVRKRIISAQGLVLLPTPTQNFSITIGLHLIYKY